jgi:hypothetical protein
MTVNNAESLTFSFKLFDVEPRRRFIQQMGLMAGAFSANSLFNQLHAASWENAASRKYMASLPEAVAADEDYWGVIQQSYYGRF